MKIKSFWRDIKSNMSIWTILGLTSAFLFLLPSLYVLLSIFTKANENWSHIQTYLLKDFVQNTAVLVFGTAFFTIVIGTSLAWLVTAYEFPFRKYLQILFVFPLAIPPYIAAYTYNTMVSYTGVVQDISQALFQRNVSIDMMSLPGAIFIFTLCLYPYVYMIVRTFLRTESASFIEAARVLGKGPWGIFVQVIVPLAKPAIVASGTLVALEVLTDYGLASYFGIRTFSTAIFQTWFGMYDLSSALKLSSMLMVVTIVFLYLERVIRGRRQFSGGVKSSRKIQRQSLSKKGKIGMLLYSIVILSFSFFIPVVQLIAWFKLTFREVLDEGFIQVMMNTLLVAVVASFIILFAATVIVYYNHTSKTKLSKLTARAATLGYSVPSTVLAIGVLAIFLLVDGLNRTFFPASNIVPSLTVAMVIFAYVTKFLAVGVNNIDGKFESMGRSYLEASRTLGKSLTKTFWQVDLPLIKGALLTSFILVIVESLKELPLALLLRPFNFETLATRAHQYAVDERIQEASVPALFIIGISLVASIIFMLLEEKKNGVR